LAVPAETALSDTANRNTSPKAAAAAAAFLLRSARLSKPQSVLL